MFSLKVQKKKENKKTHPTPQNKNNEHYSLWMSFASEYKVNINVVMIFYAITIGAIVYVTTAGSFSWLIFVVISFYCRLALKNYKISEKNSLGIET